MSDPQNPKAGEPGTGDGKQPLNADPNNEQDPKEPKGNEKEELIPRARMDQLYARLQDETRARKELETWKKEQEEKAMRENNQFKELAEKRDKELAEANAKLAEVGELEKTLQNYLTAEMETIPDERKELIPANYTTKQKIDYIIKNRALLCEAKNTQPPQNIDKSKRQPSVDGLDEKKARLEELKQKRQKGIVLTDSEARELSGIIDAIEKAATS